MEMTAQPNVIQLESHLSPEQIQHFMSVLSGSNVEYFQDPGSPPPTDEEIRQFMEYMEAGVLNEERLEYEERRRREQEQPIKRCNKTASMYFYRPKYLSVIHEEEDAEQQIDSSFCVTPRNSFASSVYESLTEADDKSWSRDGTEGSTVSTISEDTNTLIDDHLSRKKRGSNCSEFSLDSVISVNSVLSEESSTYSFVSKKSTEELNVSTEIKRGAVSIENCRQNTVCRTSSTVKSETQADEYSKSTEISATECRQEASKSLCDILQQLSPPSAKSVDTPPTETRKNNDSENKFDIETSNFETENKQINIKTSEEIIVDNKQSTMGKSLFERQLSDIFDSAILMKKKRKKSHKSGILNSLFRVHGKTDRVLPAAPPTSTTSKEKVTTTQPSSPSTVRRFFRRKPFQKNCISSLPKCRSENSLTDDSPTNIFEYESPKKANLKRSKSLNDGKGAEKKFDPKASTNPFETDEDEIVTSEKKMTSETVSRRFCVDCRNDSDCPSCLAKEAGKINRVVSVYDNMELDSPLSGTMTISELIAECEDYVKAERFTRDLSRDVANVFLEKRSNYSGKNPFENESIDSETCTEHLYEVVPYERDTGFETEPAAVSSHQTPKFPFVHMDSRDSIYENEDTEPPSNKKHEESPVDSAYGSDQKTNFDMVADLKGEEFNLQSRNNLENVYTSNDNLSTASTLKRPDSENYDSVMSEYESAMSDIEETLSHLSRRSRSLTPTFATVKSRRNIDDNYYWDSDVDISKGRYQISKTLPTKSKNRTAKHSSASLGRPSKHQDKSLKEDLAVDSIAAVFEELKDYLSESDLSLDYKIALRRRKKSKPSSHLSEDYQLSPGSLVPIRSDSLDRMREFSESISSLTIRSRSGSEDSSRSLVSYSAPATPIGARRSNDLRYRRSPSVASEISSALEPIPEEPNFDNEVGNPGRRAEIIRRSKAAARQEFFKDMTAPSKTEFAPFTTALLKISGENFNQTVRKVSPNSLSSDDEFWRSNSLPRQKDTDYGSLKRRKTLRSASLGSLLQNQSDSPANPLKLRPFDPPGMYPINPEPLNLRQSLSPKRDAPEDPSTDGMTFTSSVRVQYKPKLLLEDNRTERTSENSGIFWASVWNDDSEEYNSNVRPLYGHNQFSRTCRLQSEDVPVLVKQCPCGNKISFDPTNESRGLAKSSSASSIPNSTALRSTEVVRTTFPHKDLHSESTTDNVYFAYPVEVLPEEGSPPRPPPPVNYILPSEFGYFSLPRKFSSQYSVQSSAQPLTKSASTSLISGGRNYEEFSSPLNRFISAGPHRHFDFQKVAG